jgi:hypothetical protein
MKPAVVNVPLAPNFFSCLSFEQVWDVFCDPCLSCPVSNVFRTISTHTFQLFAEKFKNLSSESALARVGGNNVAIQLGSDI